MNNRPSAKQVLIFNRNKVLISICSSIRAAATITLCNSTAISFACTGKIISSGGFYFRHIHSNTIIEMDDLDRLKLDEYDKICNIKRVYHSRNKMVTQSEKTVKIRKSKSNLR